MNDLIVNPDKSVPGAGTFTGAKALHSAQLLANSETDLEKGLNGTVMALDIIGMVLNPLMGFAKAGVGFLIEHVGPLRDFLEILAGDPTSINATKDTWKNIEAALDQAATDLVGDAGTVADWTGDAADAYRDRLADFEAAIRAAGSASGSIAKYMEVMGIWTAVTRAIILEVICEFVARAVMYALAALAASWFTFGGSFAAMISGVIADALVQIAKIMTHLAKLGNAMSKLAGRFPKVAGSLDDAGKAVSNLGMKGYVKTGYKNIAYNRKALDQQEAAIAAGKNTKGFGKMTGTQGDNGAEIYKTLRSPWGSGNIPGTGGLKPIYDSKVIPQMTFKGHEITEGKSIAKIIGGYPMTGAKGGMKGAPAATQDPAPPESQQQQ
ncbi:hypothetical protein [Glycomyces artemisiae]|uniref:WXG100 family type VII secretion target n=2 Tax=Glycomyces artemisiae TaxID=1076443 RepID=A0A2T0US85_9ACTN|nr:hypothetical protein [Glycomyces artemisiae]PRY60764.1 hypothetical protein B0I28_102375 [Glycomyces artemisiae]